MALNAKQQLFIKEYVLDQNATRAAKAVGYSAKTARQMGSKLLSKADIARGIEIELAKAQRRLGRAALAKGVTKERWLEELSRIAFANANDYGVVKQRKVGKHTYEYVEALPTNHADPALGAVIRKIGGSKYGPVVELHSKQAALETLGKAYGWVKDSTQLEVTDGIQVVLTMPSNGREADLSEPQPEGSVSNDAAEPTPDLGST